jgi:hypothetical protein
VNSVWRSGNGLPPWPPFSSLGPWTFYSLLFLFSVSIHSSYSIFVLLFSGFWYPFPFCFLFIFLSLFIRPASFSPCGFPGPLSCSLVFPGSVSAAAFRRSFLSRLRSILVVFPFQPLLFFLIFAYFNFSLLLFSYFYFFLILIFCLSHFSFFFQFPFLF